ncbi:MAG: hypothetical protein ACYCZY_00845 [Lacisediminihabitans sp.]
MPSEKDELLGSLHLPSGPLYSIDDRPGPATAAVPSTISSAARERVAVLDVLAHRARKQAGSKAEGCRIPADGDAGRFLRHPAVAGELTHFVLLATARSSSRASASTTA